MKSGMHNSGAAWRETDRILHGLKRAEPPAAGLLEVRRALAAVIRPPRHHDVMTLDDVRDMLRLSPAELEQIVPELPLFELAGQLRIRRQRLIEWIDGREQAFARARAQTELECSLNRHGKELVA